MRAMRILYLAEIVGKAGIHCVKRGLKPLVNERQVDLVIANGDAVTGGFGLGRNHAGYLRKLGIDLITGGDQIFFKKDLVEGIADTSYVLRPANLNKHAPGRGWRHVTASGSRKPVDQASDEPRGKSVTPRSDDTTTAVDAAASQPTKLAVLSLLGQSGFERIHANNPYVYLETMAERVIKDSKALIIDFHALTTAEKYTMFHFADGLATAVIGSGQRVQTADAQVMPKGTAVICDAGRTGSQDSVGGLAPEPEIRRFTHRIPVRSAEAWARLELQGVLIEVDETSGYVTQFESIKAPVEAPQERPDGDSRNKTAATNAT